MKAGISITHGVEGPVHDPYGYTKIEVLVSNDREMRHASLKMGLGCDGKFMVIDELNGVSWITTSDEESSLVAFQKTVGISTDQAVKYVNRHHYKITSKCPKCHSRRFQWSSGYPGESFKLCAKCGEVVEYSFNESEIL